MLRKLFLLAAISLGLVGAMQSGAAAQSDEGDIHVVVNMVQLNVAVTDKKGNYVTGLKPSDFEIVEDGIVEKAATFGEGNEPVRNLGELTAKMAPGAADSADPAQAQAFSSAQSLRDLVNGANVYILFDTSDYMYRGFVFAQDAISEFVRSLEGADKIALYSYSRDLSRVAGLTSDRPRVLEAVRSTVAGDQAALYNCLLLTLKDAAQNTGRKVIVVFSNGPDNSSVVPPEDVAEFAQSAGVSIYMISTQQARLEPVSTAVFDRMTAATGGKAYFARNWKDEHEAFASIRDDLAHLYSLSYYPKFNPNAGWRSITVKLVGDRLKNCRVRTRKGYRPLPARFSGGARTAMAEPTANPAQSPDVAQPASTGDTR